MTIRDSSDVERQGRSISFLESRLLKPRRSFAPDPGAEDELGTYLVQLNNKDLMFSDVSDFERTPIKESKKTLALFWLDLTNSITLC